MIDEYQVINFWKVLSRLIYLNYYWLVVWNMFFSIQLVMSWSQLTNSIIFQRGRAQPPTRYGLWIMDMDYGKSPQYPNQKNIPKKSKSGEYQHHQDLRRMSKTGRGRSAAPGFTTWPHGPGNLWSRPKVQIWGSQMLWIFMGDCEALQTRKHQKDWIDVVVSVVSCCFPISCSFKRYEMTMKSIPIQSSCRNARIILNLNG